MKGAGVVHRRKRFITHTTLSLAFSALIALTKAQKLILLTLFATAIAGLIADRLFTAIVITAVLSSIYFIDVLFNLYLIIKSLKSPPDIKFSQQEIKDIDDKKLPVYSILVPSSGSQFFPSEETAEYTWPLNPGTSGSAE